MNTIMTNWKTTAAGALTLAAALAPIWAPPDLAHKLQMSAGVFVASGLLAAKDGNR
jgi:hypothetical protein